MNSQSQKRNVPDSSLVKAMKNLNTLRSLPWQLPRSLSPDHCEKFNPVNYFVLKKEIIVAFIISFEKVLVTFPF